MSGRLLHVAAGVVSWVVVVVDVVHVPQRTVHVDARSIKKREGAKQNGSRLSAQKVGSIAPLQFGLVVVVVVVLVVVMVDVVVVVVVEVVVETMFSSQVPHIEKQTAWTIVPNTGSSHRPSLKAAHSCASATPLHVFFVQASHVTGHRVLTRNPTIR
jgi:hypothetical protein